MWKSGTPSPPLAILPTQPVFHAGERVWVKGTRFLLTPLYLVRGRFRTSIWRGFESLSRWSSEGFRSDRR
jgi:hypothetical protein